MSCQKGTFRQGSCCAAGASAFSSRTTAEAAGTETCRLSCRAKRRVAVVADRECEVHQV
jgi:hypothetical protein